MTGNQNQLAFHGRPFLQAPLITLKPLSQHLMGGGDDHKGVGVGPADRLLHRHDLPLLEGAENDPLLFPRLAALSLKVGDPPGQLLQNHPGDLLGMVGNNIGHLGVV